MANRPSFSYAAMAQHASFEHERLKLSDRSIRLFQVQRGGKDEPISLRMTQFSAVRQPKYKAVSYTWGSSANPKQILVNGKAFPLHVNLWNLLYHLRLFGETSFIWADALCINQLNLKERNFHVQLMGKIYQRAESVIVWLGLPSPERIEIRAMDFIKEIAMVRKQYSDTMFLKSYSKPELHHRWENLERFTDHYYWHRTWIIQEFLFAPALEVFSGKEKLDWNDFENLVDFLRHEPVLATRPVIAKILQSRTTRLTFRRKAGSITNLHELLREYADSTCTERRDKIYGVLGLASDCLEDPETGEASGVKPDYEKHIIDVFLDALNCIHASLPLNTVLPAATLLILRALHIQHGDLADYLTKVEIPAYIRPRLIVTPTYVSPILATFRWTNAHDLERQLLAYDWGEHIGYEVKRVPSKTLMPNGSKVPRLRRLSSNSRPIHADLPGDFVSNAVYVANISASLANLHNYPCNHDLELPLEFIPLHVEDKRTFGNSELAKPPCVLEQHPNGEALRLGFACTNVQRGDLIMQFAGLSQSVVVRQTGLDLMLLGKSMMVNNAGIKHEEPVDPVCAPETLTSHCLCRHNPDNLQLDTDPLSLAELLTDP